MSSPAQFIEDAVQSARRAVQFDTEGQINAAAYYYKVSSQLLEKAAAVSDADKGKALLARSTEYAERARVLELKGNVETQIHEDVHKRNLKRCGFLLQQALDADMAGAKDTAVELYTNAIEFITKNPELMQGELKDLALQALDRAEALKGIKYEGAATAVNISQLYAVPVKTVPSLHRGTNVTLKVAPGKETYTDEEKRVLLHTSHINNKEYVPFMSIDLAEKFQYAFPFTDKDGLLALSPKQKREFAKWIRPEEISSEPCIVLGSHPDYFSIKQTIVSDCSFVASLAVSASYEKRFGRRLVTSILYPRSRDKKPLYNPFGKYMVKLHLNGVSRKVIIDDLLPLNKHGKLLCSYSSNRNELWISLLEKAYMKVMGGYDFPGSNSNIDLHALTGWIPERAAIHSNDPDFNRDALFTKLETRLAKGDVLVTVATGELSDVEAERTGLVSTHAYAVMDVRTVNGLRLLQLKNPWSHLRWRGNYSELDIKHWTGDLKQALAYDPDSASQFDNGVFWIDYDSICRFFDVFYMNWNPELFKHTYCIHQSWNAGVGPVKDAYNIGANPQFTLDVGNETGAVWILLSRHITQIEDFRENREFITVLVYKGNGRRVYYPSDPPPYIDGVRINSPHYLCKLIIGPDSVRRYTLVISQYEKSQTIYYTLRVYATCPFVLNKISNVYAQKMEISGEWNAATAGGCGNYPATFRNNPRYKVTIDSLSNDNSVLVELKGPKQYQMGFDVTIVSVNDPSVTAPFKTTSSGAYRSGYVVLELENLPAGVLHVTPSTFYPNQEGPFIVSLKSSATIQIVRDR